MRKLKAFTLYFAAGANIVSIVLMLLVGYSGRINPVGHPLIANISLTFPVFLFVNIAFLFFWLIFKVKGALLPVAGFILAYSPVHTYVPFNVPQEKPEGAIMVMSYNVCMFLPWEVPEGQSNPIADDIIKANPDILCLQEASLKFPIPSDVMHRLKKQYAYCDTTYKGRDGSCLALFSKFPILSRKQIRYKSIYNMSMAYMLNIHGDTVIVINNHFEGTGLTLNERREFRRMLKGELKAYMARKESQRLIDRLATSTATRAPQADSVAAFVKANKRHSIILCGDFNDNPLSYTRTTLGDVLTDCYIATGNGPGISYHDNRMYVRIDNIMCSDEWIPYACKVDNRMKHSDHYPIYCWLKKREKE